MKEQKFQEKARLQFLDEVDRAFDQEVIKPRAKGGIKVPKEIISGITELKDRARLLMNVLSPTRVIEKIAGPNAQVYKDFFFDRVKQGSLAVQNFIKATKGEIQNVVIDGLGIKPRSLEDKLTMAYGEGRITLDELKEKVPQAWEKIVEADNFFRQKYDTMLTQINDTLTRFGYDPVTKRQDYYTHYKELGNNFITALENLPTTISGTTAYFKPGKKFFKFGLQRKGDEFTESAIGSIDKYIEPAALQVYMTDAIQRGRTLINTIEQQVGKNPNLEDTFLTNFKAWLEDQVNIIAGKKGYSVRGDEATFGRNVYNSMKILKNQVSKNLVAGSISSSLTNLIPAFAQIPSQVERGSYIKGLVGAVLNPLIEHDNYIIDGIQSSFLRRRYPVSPLAPTTIQMLTEKVGWLFQTIDQFSANVAVQSKYFEQLKLGKTAQEAMTIADDFAERILGDRSFGQLPQLFTDQGVKGFFLQFQVEPTNQIANALHDLPYSGMRKKAIASVIIQLGIYSWLFNTGFEKVIGRRPLFDPIDSTIETLKELNTPDSAGKKFAKIGQHWIENLPVVQVAMGGGRIPLFAGFSSIDQVVEDPFGSALRALGVYASPVGGGYQVYKTFEGARALLTGYAQSLSGQVKFPIQADPINIARGILFGRYSFPEARDYYENERSPLGYTDSAEFKQLQARDPEAAKQFYNSLQVERELSRPISKANQEKNKMMLIMSDPKSSEMDKKEAYQSYQKVAGDLANKAYKASGIENEWHFSPAPLEGTHPYLQPRNIAQAEQVGGPVNESLADVFASMSNLKAGGTGKVPSGTTTPTSIATNKIITKGKKAKVPKLAIKTGKALKFKIKQSKTATKRSTSKEIKYAPRKSGGKIAAKHKGLGLKIKIKPTTVRGLRVYT